MKFFAKQSIGIEIDATTIRVVAVKGGKKPSFVGCKEVVLVASVETDKLSSEDIVRALKEALAGAVPGPIRPSECVLSIAEEEVFRKVVELPASDREEELLEAARLEVAQFLPNKMEESEIDLQVLGKNGEEGLAQTMVVAVPKATLWRWIDILNLARLPLRAVDVQTESLARAVVPFQEKKAIVLVSLYPKSSVVSVYQGGAVRVSSTLNTGIGNGAEDEELSEAAFTRLKNALADEIDHVVKFYTNRTAEHVPIKEVQIAGLKGPEAKGLLEELHENLDLPVVLAKPMLQAPAFCDGRFLTAMGAALYPWHYEL